MPCGFTLEAKGSRVRSISYIVFLCLQFRTLKLQVQKNCLRIFLYEDVDKELDLKHSKLDQVLPMQKSSTKGQGLTSELTGGDVIQVGAFVK